MIERLKNLYKEKFDRIEAYWILVIYGAGIVNGLVFTKMSTKEGFIFLGVAFLVGLVMAYKAGKRDE